MDRGARDAGRNGGKPPVMGVFSDSRVAWVDFPTFQMVQFIGTDGDDRLREFDGSDPHKLTIRSLKSRQVMQFMLTAMTTEELDVFQKFINKVCDDARPESVRLDALAKEAGDDSLARIYRTVPVIHERQRKASQHGESLRDGPEGAVPGGGGPADG